MFPLPAQPWLDLARSSFSNPSPEGTEPFVGDNVWLQAIATEFKLGFNASNLKSSENLTTPNWLLDRLFTDTLIDTNDPALALQAFFTAVFRSAYLDAVPTFNVRQPITMRLVDRLVYPRGFTGLIIVIVTTAAHWALCMVFVALFRLKTNYSVLNDAWAVVLQALTSEIENHGPSSGSYNVSLQLNEPYSRSEDGSKSLVRLRPTRERALSINGG